MGYIINSGGGTLIKIIYAFVVCACVCGLQHVSSLFIISDSVFSFSLVYAFFYFLLLVCFFVQFSHKKLK